MIKELTTASQTLNDKLSAALTELATLKAVGDNKTTIAKLEGKVAESDAYHKAFMAGLQKGLELGSGKAVALTPGSSVGSGSRD